MLHDATRCTIHPCTGVNMLAGVSYEKIDDQGLHLKVDGESRLLDVDNVVVCAGQEPLNDLQV